MAAKAAFSFRAEHIWLSRPINGDTQIAARIGSRAKMPFPIHPHMLRHGCGYALANAGHDTRSLQAQALNTRSRERFRTLKQNF
jgi:integrase